MYICLYVVVHFNLTSYVTFEFVLLDIGCQQIFSHTIIANIRLNQITVESKYHVKSVLLLHC